MIGSAEVRRILRGTWVHIDGDSLSRGMFFDLAELLKGGTGSPKCPRESVHANRELCEHYVRITFAWNHAFSKAAKLASAEESDAPMAHNETSWGEQDLCSDSTRSEFCGPDVWVWSPGKWFGVYRPPDKEEFGLMAKRIKRLAAKYASIAGTRFVLRAISPYKGHRESHSASRREYNHFFELDYANATNWVWFQHPAHRLPAFEMDRLHLLKPPKFSSIDTYHEWIYRKSRRIFSDEALLDAWQITAPRGDAVGADGIHARGILSKMITNVLLHLLRRLLGSQEQVDSGSNMLRPHTACRHPNT